MQLSGNISVLKQTTNSIAFRAIFHISPQPTVLQSRIQSATAFHLYLPFSPTMMPFCQSICHKMCRKLGVYLTKSLAFYELNYLLFSIQTLSISNQNRSNTYHKKKFQVELRHFPNCYHSISIFISFRLDEVKISSALDVYMDSENIYIKMSIRHRINFGALQSLKVRLMKVN